jgi:trans-aconitate methyltransferase
MLFSEEFDIAFCNSALQWFSRPQDAISSIRKSLVRGGKMGVACPGTTKWSPFFMDVVESVSKTGVFKLMFEHWHSPWFFLPTIEDYAGFFEDAGFVTRHLSIEHETRCYTVEEAFGVYRSGAANGFTAKECFDIDISDEFVVSFNKAVKTEFERRAKDGKVELDFNRMYYTGEKT